MTPSEGLSTSSRYMRNVFLRTCFVDCTWLPLYRTIAGVDLWKPQPATSHAAPGSWAGSPPFSYACSYATSQRQGLLWFGPSWRPSSRTMSSCCAVWKASPYQSVGVQPRLMAFLAFCPFMKDGPCVPSGSCGRAGVRHLSISQALEDKVTESLKQNLSPLLAVCIPQLCVVPQ